MNIIGISGLAGSGKDTVADMLLKYDGFVKVSLADPIKRFAAEMWGFSEEQLFGPSQYRNAPDSRYEISPGNFLTPRKVLQHLGTEGGRAIDYDVWIRYAIKIAKTLLESEYYNYAYSAATGIQPYYSGYEYMRENIPGFTPKVKAVIIPDCRFHNEIWHIKDAGGILIRVVRPGAGLKDAFGPHPSEAEMANIPNSDFSAIIENTGTLEDLQHSVDVLVRDFL